MQSADIFVNINEIWTLSTDLHKIPNIKFHNNSLRHKRAYMYGQTDIYDEASSRFSPIYGRTQNDLHATSHTCTHIPISDMTADQAFRHALISYC
jgi:hypothetical protein